MESKFFSFIKPYLHFIDDGHMFRKPFSWLYTIIAGLNLLIPIFVFVQAVQNDVFDMKGKFIVVFILVWIVIAFAGWISFQLWWDRKDAVLASSVEGDEFAATPVFSHFIQTLGEWAGTWIGIVGTSFAIIATIFLGDEGSYLSSSIGLDFMEANVLSIILMPIYGFLLLVGSRFIAESFRALTSIANNTKK